jgi:hypothetical protein
VADDLGDCYFPEPNVLSFSKIMCIYIHFHAKAKLREMVRNKNTIEPLIKNITSKPLTRSYQKFLPVATHGHIC